MRLAATLKRALARRCPRCGVGALYEPGRWYRLQPSCAHCGQRFDRERGDFFGPMYFLMAFMNGALFLGVYFLGPESFSAKRWILAALLLVTNGALLPFRKSLAIALDYRLDRLEDPGSSR